MHAKTQKARVLEGYTKRRMQSVSRVAYVNSFSGGWESERSGTLFIFHLPAPAVGHHDKTPQRTFQEISSGLGTHRSRRTLSPSRYDTSERSKPCGANTTRPFVVMEHKEYTEQGSLRRDTSVFGHLLDPDNQRVPRRGKKEIAKWPIKQKRTKTNTTRQWGFFSFEHRIPPCHGHRISTTKQEDT